MGLLVIIVIRVTRVLRVIGQQWLERPVVSAKKLRNGRFIHLKTGENRAYQAQFLDFALGYSGYTDYKNY
jgi:hypothetical protein